MNIELDCIRPEFNNFKTYKISIEDHKVNCAWGRIGRTLQNKEFKFESQKSAIKFYEKKVQEKLKKGYKIKR